jgi:hypothetical protein
MQAVMLSAAMFTIHLQERGDSVMRAALEAEPVQSAPKRAGKVRVKGTGGQGGTGRRRVKRGGKR